MKMPDFPEPFDPAKQTLAQYLGNTVELEYERSRAEAWEARARLAVFALSHYANAQTLGEQLVMDLREGTSDLSLVAKEALSAIGELPPA